ncbi:hypothetical protein A2765_06400 [Candidatus Kaiserbacteria bacterium RIFCSPHIGHO2_01_FULL_56_24]|uniref:DoxX family protein n=1 Tax=Candidatus Kaiserbacteria bacterium RIFCSPHIGHO2_01_FULL_56_24 TaxID=1798487 RepID=A0A1F6DHN9_9BACT|nr:MAG: hypothetical protein A2765_06400 [Candidatus Kaiserbacteria bacterium RIFCSPHIGHO2_01_FULL_56_24]
MNRDPDRTGVANLILRIGLAFAFLYPPWNALSNPESWIAYFPPFMRGIVPDAVLLHSFGALEIVIALWILSGWRIFWPSLAAAAILLAIIVFDFSNFEVIFRDVAIATIAIALAVQNRRELFNQQRVPEHAI